MSLQVLFYFLLTLSILVFVHELGHYYLARCCGVKVLSFSIGFGKPILSISDNNGTKWLFSIIPFGGYVKMLDDRNQDVNIDQRKYCFNHKSKLQKSLILFAGPFANFLLGCFLYSVIAFIGIDGKAPLIGSIEERSPAKIYGLKSGDIIHSIDSIAIETQYDLSIRLAERIGDTGFISFEIKSEDSIFRNIKIPIKNWLRDERSPDFYKSLGFNFFVPDAPIIIDEVFESSPASQGGLQTGDILLSVNNQSLKNWTQLVEIIRKSPNKKLDIYYERGGEKFSSALIVESNFYNGNEYGSIGVSSIPVQWPEELIIHKKYSFISSLNYGITKTKEMIQFTTMSIYKLISGAISSSSLSGPITIAKYATSSAQSGFTFYLGFLALLSISLGVLNLLPIPMLDGGQLLIIFIEGIIGRSIPENILIYLQQLGLFIILSIMALAIFNDFTG